MRPPSPKYQWLVWGGLGMVVLAIVLAFARSFEAGDPLPVYGEVPAFSLTNEAGKTVTRDSLLGRVWICDVIFTR